MRGFVSRWGWRAGGAVVLVPVLLFGLRGLIVSFDAGAPFGPPTMRGGRISSTSAALASMSAHSVLPDLTDTAPMPTSAGLRRTLAPLLRADGLGTDVSLDVLDATTGTPLMSMAAQRPLTPASTVKLLTGAAALAALGPQTTLATQVVQGTTDDEVVLVGSGDVLLDSGHGDPSAVVGRAGLADLAVRTATALQAQGRTTVVLRLDDTLFTGSAVSSAWSSGDVSAGFVAPVMPVGVNAGQVSGRTARRSDPALSAATTFAGLLDAQGITVSGRVTRADAPESPTVLAEVRSAPVGDLVEHILTESDNTVAEVLARLVAVQDGRAGTFADAGAAVVERVGLLGVPVEGVRLVGGSGLARGSVVPARTLTRLLALAAGRERPELRWMLTGLPVAGASGTLADRFDGSGQSAALGIVRAKTGTLTGVNSLAGIVVDSDGRLLAFAVMADRTGGSRAARAALDAFAAALAGCGCR